MRGLFVIYDGIQKPQEFIAKSKGEAIKTFLEKTGMPEDFFKQHCKIVYKGVVKKEKGDEILYH